MFIWWLFPTIIIIIACIGCRTPREPCNKICAQIARQNQRHTANSNWTPTLAYTHTSHTDARGQVNDTPIHRCWRETTYIFPLSFHLFNARLLFRRVSALETCGLEPLLLSITMCESRWRRFEFALSIQRVGTCVGIAHPDFCSFFSSSLCQTSSKWWIAFFIRSLMEFIWPI